MANLAKKVYEKNQDQLSKLYKIAQGDRTLVQFAFDAGISAGNLSRILRGQVAYPATLKRLADCSDGVSYAELMIAAGYLPPPEMGEYLSSPAFVEDDSSDEIIIDVEPIEEKSLVDYSRTISVPVVTHLLSHPRTLSRDNVSTVLNFPETFMGQGDFIMYNVEDDYFAPRISAGDMVIIDISKQPVPGDIALVRVDKNVTLIRRFAYDYSRIMLYGQAGSLPPTAYPKAKVELIGVVVKSFINDFE